MNVVGAVRDAGKDNWRNLFNQMDALEGRVAIVKKYCKYGRGKIDKLEGGDDDDDTTGFSLDKVVENIEVQNDTFEEAFFC